jgi:hypothetical protein
MDFTAVYRFNSQAAGFVKPRSPEPFVKPLIFLTFRFGFRH